MGEFTVAEALEILRQALNALPASRERSLALTKVDEAEMWAERAAGTEETT